MKIVHFYKNTKKKIKDSNIVLYVSVVYNFSWAIGKILFGVFARLYFFCVSGASTLLFGFIKRMYLKNYDNDDIEERKGKSLAIAILLIASSSLFIFYMARLFFVDTTMEYGLIMSISIAAFSFTELGLSIYQFMKAKQSQDILNQSFRACSLASSCYAIALTQVALLSATKTSANSFNAITGIVAGVFSILIAVYIMTKIHNFSSQSKQ